ncbi:hypothetical protein [Paraburkholderia rhynchosiae]|uniref:DNA-binding protein n=1 Tax=Paraburkholderia rhynchosiae TaxID=487049 RepID=A0A2N7W9A2_9BURK|nr:hypothetical protein [Paraburkholderia rhynchosiae]PMS25986.1 hypothetical protein C0Z16_28035 [Paraburkholderia rhynchosiae]CAB3730853.1 hypothetical protein LMG27174_05784 [Paraburkholderia rhynchosiae]
MKEGAKHEGIFKDAKEAIVFSLNFSDQQYAKSPMALLLKHGAHGSGRGLSGLDGSGQAGMVFAEIIRLDYHESIALIARCSAKRLRCTCGSPCCSKWTPNPIWTMATSQLCDHALLAVGTGISSRAIRLASTQKFFGQKLSIQEIADYCSVSRKTAGEHHARIKEFLKDLEGRAWFSFTARLEDAGMLIRDDEPVSH